MKIDTVDRKTTLEATDSGLRLQIDPATAPDDCVLPTITHGEEVLAFLCGHND